MQKKEITLVFTPFSLENNIDDKTVDDYKNRVFQSWKRRAIKNGKNESLINEILPTDTAPVSLGQLCLISYLKKRGVQVNYIYGDYLIKKQGLSVSAFEEYIIEVSKNSCMVGFYSMTPTIMVTLALIEAVKKRNTDIVTVLGGPHGTYADVQTLKDNSFVDVVVRSEGEETTLELFDVLSKEGEITNRLGKIRGITYRDNGKIKRNEDRDLMDAKDIPSPNYCVLPQDFNCLLTVMYARGCPYTCRFCAEGSMWRHKLRYRNPEVVADEIKHIMEHWQQRVIHICDSEIDVIPAKLEALMDAIISRNISCKLTVNLRCDAHKRLTPQLLMKMKKAGIVAYLIGSESASDRMLEIMGRGAKFSDFIKTVQLLRESDAGFIFPGVMIGFPGETTQTIKKTKTEFLKLLDNRMIDYFFPRVFIPYPGSEPFECPEKYNIKLSLDWQNYVRYGISQPFDSMVLSKKALKEEMFKFYRELAEHSEQLEVNNEGML